MNKALKFGAYIRQMPFEIFLRYFFPIVHKSPYTKEKYHDKIFNYFHNVYDLNDNYRYCNLNLAPRSGKTVNSIWFMYYAIINNDCEFIYTSFSSAVLKDVLEEFKLIHNNPIISAMYGHTFSIEDIEDIWVDEMWKDLYKENNKKEKELFSSKRIKLGKSVIHLVPTGSSPTGIGFGKRGVEHFSGMLLMDDFQKPIEVKNSELMRNKTNSFFPTSLVSRGNGVHAMGNICQRICIGDFTEYLEDEYNFKTIKAPLMIDGVCQLPSQYDDKLLKLIQRSNDNFQAQYQQEPIIDGGNLFKKDWFEFSSMIPSLDSYSSIFLTADTAFTDKQQADYSVITTYGILENKLYVLDCFRKKVDSIDLPKIIQDINLKYQDYRLDYTWIEPKASGQTIIQALRKYSNGVKIPKEDDVKKYMKRIVNKVERANDCIGWIDAESKNIVFNNNIEDIEEIKAELFNFPNAVNDDFVDTFIDGVNLFAKYYVQENSDMEEVLKIRQQMGV